MPTLQKKRIKAFLHKTYKDKIHLNTSNRSDADKDKLFLTHALTAHSLTIEAFTAPEISALSVIDDFDDNGIDAVYFNESKNILWLVQSKSLDSSKGVAVSDVHKFIKGIKDLINLDFDKFGNSISNKLTEIQAALENPDVCIHLIIAHTSKELSTHSLDVIQTFLKEQNDTEDLFIFHDCNLDKIYKGLTVNDAPINEDFLISNWGFTSDPQQSYYGQIAASDLASLWQKYNERLFTKNIRGFLGNSQVNENIKISIINEPENFIYYNNGITILCSSIKKKPQGGSSKDIGSFYCTDVSVVNGAQTFGTIGTLFNNDNADLSKVYVFVRFISLESSSATFGEKITIATNTQNKIDKKDFVSLDQEQERLKSELRLEGIEYHYKRSDKQVVLDDKNYSFEDIAFSQACLWSDIDYSTMVKKQSGKLWEDPQQAPYTNIFNSNTTTEKIIKAVRIYRYINNIMGELAKDSSGRTKSINNYGNAFITHITMQQIPKKLWNDSQNQEFEKYFTDQLHTIVTGNILLLQNLIEQEYPDSMIVYILRNYTKCRKLKEKFTM